MGSISMRPIISDRIEKAKECVRICGTCKNM